MAKSKLSEKKWDGHFAFFHLKEFQNAKEIYLNGKRIKWHNRFKNGDIVEIIDRPFGIIEGIATALSVALASTFGVTISYTAAMVAASVIAGLGIVGIGMGISAISASLMRTSASSTTQNKEYSSSSNPELKGASNDISSDIIPVVFGTTRQTPSYGQTPYRLVGDGSGSNKYRQYFIANYNNVVYSDFKLGETSIDNYSNNYYDIKTVSGSQNYIGFENVKALSVDEELSYNKEGEITQSSTQYINEEVSASSIGYSFTVRFENVADLKTFSSKTFSVIITGENNENPVILTQDFTITNKNISKSGDYYIYAGSASWSQGLTYLTSVQFTPSENTRNNATETNNKLNTVLQNEEIKAGDYVLSLAPEQDVNKYQGTPSEVINTSPENTTEIDVILSFPQGLYKLNKSNAKRLKRSISVEIMYKPENSSVWKDISSANSLYIRDINGIKQPLSSSTTTIEGNKVTLQSPADLNVADQLFFRPVGFSVPKGKYSVRVRSAEYTDKTNYDIGVANCAEIQFRCSGNVVNPDILPKVNQIAFDVTAYKGLSGTLKKFNYMAQALIPVWNGSNWDTVAKSSNPAAIVRYLLTSNRVNPRAESIEHIDNESLIEFYNWCEQEKYKADGVIAEACKIGEIVNDILQHSQCAMIPLYNGKHTFVIDKKNKTPLGMFNQHNSWNFKWTPNVGRQTEAIRVTFTENDDWSEDELTLYWYDGEVHDEPKSGTSDADYELVKKEYKYVCDRASVRKITAYELETIQTKRNTFEFDVNLEALNMMLLDRVYISNTANMQNESTGLIKSVITENTKLLGFKLYSEIDIPQDAKIIIRSLDYDNKKPVINIYDVANVGLSNEVIIEPVNYDGVIRGAGEIMGLQDTWHYDGDLFTLGQDTIYDCTVTDIKYNDDGTATITARDY